MVADKNTACKITVCITGDYECKIKLYKKTSDGWDYIVDLYDDGQLNQNGDEIANDGLYTNSIFINEGEPKILQYKAVILYDGIEIDSSEVSVEIMDSISVDENEYNLNLSNHIMEMIQVYMEKNEYDYNHSVNSIFELIYDYCDKSNVDICIENGSTIKLIFENSQEIYIQLSDKSDMNTMIRGGGVNNIDNNSETIEIATTEARSILYWAPFDSAWGDYDETECIKDIVNDSVYCEDFEIKSDSNANVESLKDIYRYGLIILATHGIGGKWIVTGEEVTDPSKYLSEISRGEIEIYYDYDPNQNTYKPYYMVNDKWISNNVKSSLPASIIINNSCESSKQDYLWDAFKNLGCATYYGNNGAITNFYATLQCSNLVSKLLVGKELAVDAYMNTLDGYYNEGASLIARGQANITVNDSLNNPSFEYGVRNWSLLGDCRSITKLGNIVPTEGKYMGMISTGIGNNMKPGTISQRIGVLPDASKLCFDWNFLSAEFLEYINSSFDDPFEIIVKCIDEKDKEEVLFRKSVNTIAKEYGASRINPGELIGVSSNVRINGYSDIWMTGWQSETIDISKYAGRTIRISFSVANAHDTAYPSAVLLDKIYLDKEYKSSPKYIEISIPEKKKINTDGRSYVLYSKEFVKEAEVQRKQIMYLNGYKSLNQVYFKQIDTEDEFVEEWQDMMPGGNDSCIDTVAILMHGNYYAVIIDNGLNEAENDYREGALPQNLTASSDCKVGSDYSATYIGTLKKKNIKKLYLLSCNTGLLDAININYRKKLQPITGHGGETYTINGNVAQAFMKLNCIDEIIAYDGSVGYTSGMPRISYLEDHYLNYLNELNDQRKIVPYRFNAGMEYFGVSYVIKNGIDAYKSGVMPNGEVTYKNNEAIYNFYQLEHRATDGLIPVTYTVLVKHTARVNLDTNTQIVSE